MTERNPGLAVLCLIAGCFAIAVGLFAARSAMMGLMFMALGTQMLVMAALNALPNRLRRIRTVLRVLGILLPLVVVPLAIAVIVAELR